MPSKNKNKHKYYKKARFDVWKSIKDNEEKERKLQRKREQKLIKYKKEKVMKNSMSVEEYANQQQILVTSGKIPLTQPIHIEYGPSVNNGYHRFTELINRFEEMHEKSNQEYLLELGRIHQRFIDLENQINNLVKKESSFVVKTAHIHNDIVNALSEIKIACQGVKEAPRATIATPVYQKAPPYTLEDRIYALENSYANGFVMTKDPTKSVHLTQKGIAHIKALKGKTIEYAPIQLSYIQRKLGLANDTSIRSCFENKGYKIQATPELPIEELDPVFIDLFKEVNQFNEPIEQL